MLLKEYDCTLSEFANALFLSRPTLNSYIHLYENNQKIPDKKYQILFDRMFSKKIEKEDKIYVTDIYDNKVVYVVYDIYKVFPKEVECLSQDTDGEREITLITCTKGAIKRLIIKAVEVYD